MTSTITYAFSIVMAINVLLFLGQASILDLNPDAATLFNCEGSTLGTLEASGCTDTSLYLLNDTNPATGLPSSESSISPETGNVFTDSFTAIKNWLLQSTGITYLVQMLTAPSNVLKAMGAPSELSFALGALWYTITLLLFIAFLTGREG